MEKRKPKIIDVTLGEIPKTEIDKQQKIDNSLLIGKTHSKHRVRGVSIE